MDRELFKKCMDALRSGKYKQCRRWLHTPEGYCYQGVCMEVAYPGLEWKLIDEIFGFPLINNVRYLPSVGGGCAAMTTSLIERLGLNIMIDITGVDLEGSVYTDKLPLWRYLAELNDGGFSLEFIANVAESYLGGDDGET